MGEISEEEARTTEAKIIHTFWMQYGCSPEEYYELPLWRAFRQLAAIRKVESEKTQKSALSARMAYHAKSEEFTRYIKGMVASSLPTIASKHEAESFGLGYKHGSTSSSGT